MATQTRRKELSSLLRTNKNKRLPSKLCGYNEKQQLICKICSVVIKNRTLWKTHERSPGHQQTLKNLLKLKAERDANKCKGIEKENALKQNEETSSTQTNGDAQTEEDKKVNDEEEEDKEEVLMVDGLPINFFDKAMMKYKQPMTKKQSNSKKKTIKAQNESSDHVVIVVDKANEEQKKNKNMDDTDTALLKLENEMKIEQEKRDDELLEFMKEIDQKMANEENEETKFKINNLQQYRDKLKHGNNGKKRKLSDDQQIASLPNKKQKINTESVSDSDFDEDDIFNLDSWRTQKI